MKTPSRVRVIKKDQQNEGKAMDDAIAAIKKEFNPKKNAERKAELHKKRMADPDFQIGRAHV